MAVGFGTGRNTNKLDMVKWGWKAMKMRDGSWDFIKNDWMCL